jgi:hypothetical protein
MLDIQTSWRREGARTGLYLGFEVLTSVVMKSFIFLDLMLCNPLKVN